MVMAAGCLGGIARRITARKGETARAGGGLEQG